MVCTLLTDYLMVGQLKGLTGGAIIYLEQIRQLLRFYKLYNLDKGATLYTNWIFNDIICRLDSLNDPTSTLNDY